MGWLFVEELLRSSRSSGDGLRKVVLPQVLEVEKVGVADDDAEQVALWQCIVDEEREAKEDPGEVGRAKDKQAEERQPDGGVLAGPDVDERKGQWGSEKRERREWGEEQEGAGRVDEQHDKVPRAAPVERLFEHPAVAAHEKDVKHEIQTERAKVEKRCHEPPILLLLEGGVPAEKELVGRDNQPMEALACLFA